MSFGGWRIATASATGTSHLRAATSCQDSVVCTLTTSNAGEEILIAAVSDGAGSETLSKIGSEIACTAFRDLVQLYFTVGGQIEGISQETAHSWVSLVRRQIEDAATAQQISVKRFACTLLAVVAGPRISAFLQIGDGAFVIDDPLTGWQCVFWPQKGEFANTTNFLTQDNPTAAVDFKIVDRTVRDIALFTDGIESLVLNYNLMAPHAPYFDQMFSTFRESASEGHDLALSATLQRYLESPKICDRTDDDKTLLLASRTPTRASLDEAE